MVGVAAALGVDDGSVSEARVAVTGVIDRAVRLTGVEDAIEGGSLDEAAVVAAAGCASGDVDAERAVDDCGPRVNPAIVEGQVHGGVAQGVGQAGSEAAVYGDDGALPIDEMLQYALPRAADLPDVETLATETPSPHNDLGVKGIGEAGTIAAPPAVVNAVIDALEPLGVEHVDMPLTEERILRTIDANRE